MKSLVKSLVIVASVGLFSTSVSAATFVSRDTIVTQDTIVQDTVKKEEPKKEVCMVADEVTYSKIELSAIPEVVSTALATKYEGATVEEAFKGTDNSYKLIVKKEETKLVLYFTEDGEFVKEEACPADKKE